jgi:hypothetical protein
MDGWMDGWMGRRGGRRVLAFLNSLFLWNPLFLGIHFCNVL